MDNSKNILTNTINNEANEKLEHLSDIYDVYKIFTENGYTGSYENFEKDILNFFVNAKMSDRELEKISGGETQKANRILASMFSVLIIADPILNISAAASDAKPTDFYASQTTSTSKSGKILDKITALLKNNLVRNVLIGSALATPLLTAGGIGLYKHFTSINHRFSQIIDYCLKNKDKKESLADDKYKNMLKVVLLDYKKLVEKQMKKTDHSDKQNVENLNAILSNIAAYVNELNGSRQGDTTIQRLGEIVADNFFMFAQANMPKLQEFLAIFGKEAAPNPFRDQLKQAQQQLDDANNRAAQVQQQLDDANKRAAQVQQQLDDANKRAAQVQQQLDDANDRAAQAQQQFNAQIAEYTNDILMDDAQLKLELIKSKLETLKYFIPQYYTSTDESEKKSIEEKKEHIIDIFSGCTTSSIAEKHKHIGICTHLLISERKEVEKRKLMRLLNWLGIENRLNIGHMPDELNKKLKALGVADVYDCINFVLSPDATDIPRIMKIFGKESLISQQDRESRERKISRQLLIQDLIQENLKAWESLVKKTKSGDFSPYEDLSYYVGVLSSVHNKIYEDDKYLLLRPKKDTLCVDHETNTPYTIHYMIFVPSESYVYIRDYILNACEQIYDILNRSNGGKEQKYGEISIKSKAEEVNKALNTFLNGERQLNIASHYVDARPLAELLDSVYGAIKDLPLDNKNFERSVNQLEKKFRRITQLSPTFSSLLQSAGKYSRDAYVEDKPIAPGNATTRRQIYEGKWFGNTKLKSIPGEELWSGFVHYDELNKAVFVAYRGTYSREDLFTDIYYSFTPCDFLGNKNVHSGFYERYKKLVKK